MNIQRLKLLTETTTQALLLVSQDIPSHIASCQFPPEFSERGDEASMKEITMQRSMVKLIQLNMKMREELILLGVTYEKKDTSTKSYSKIEEDGT